MAAALLRCALASALNPLLLRLLPRPLLAAAAGPAGALLPRPPGPGLLPGAGFKTKGVIRKRCRDCRLVKRRGRWFVYCEANPKHKQRQM